MGRMESQRVDEKRGEDGESGTRESEKSQGKMRDLGEFRFREPGPPSSPRTSSSSSHTSRLTQGKTSKNSKDTSAASTTSKLSPATEIHESFLKMLEQEKKISQRLDELEGYGKCPFESDLNT